jgi:fibrillarin-like rRNA methylase
MEVAVERKTNERETVIMSTHTHMYKAENVEKKFVREQASPGEPVNSERIGTIHHLEYSSWSLSRCDKTLAMEITYRGIRPWKGTVEHR